MDLEVDLREVVVGESHPVKSISSGDFARLELDREPPLGFVTGDVPQLEKASPDETEVAAFEGLPLLLPDRPLEAGVFAVTSELQGLGVFPRLGIRSAL